MSPDRPAVPDKDEARLLDEAIDRLQRGDRAGLDRLDRELAETVDLMVGWAREAGWSRNSIGDRPPATGRLTRFPAMGSWLAAAIVVVLVGSLGLLAWQGLEDGRRSEPTQAPPLLAASGSTAEAVAPEQTSPASGGCDRGPRPAAEVARIVRAPSTTWDAPRGGDRQTFAELQATLTQVTRDWTACLAAGRYDRAMAYESANYLRALAAASGTPIGEDLTAEQVAAAVADRHRGLVPMAHGEGVEIRIYTFSWTIGNAVAEVWMVPVTPSGDWVEWPTVITFVYEDGRWVIELTDREGSPATPVPEPGR